jgi:hypothetical protein
MKLASRKATAGLVGILFGCTLAAAQDKQTDLEAGSVAINFVLPAGLQPLSEQKMALVREKGVAAKFIFSDPQSDVMLAINTFGYNATEKGLSDVGDSIIAGAEQQNPQVELLKRDMITMNGRRWLRLSFKEKGGAVDLIDTYFVTDWAGQYVLFNYSATSTKYENYKSAFERSAQSIQLGLIATSIELDGGATNRPRRKPRP